MANFYSQYPPSGIATYPTFADFPTSAPNGTLALALDTDNLYAYNTTSMTWVEIGGPGSALSLGAFDSEAADARGANLVGGILAMQSASTAVPGSINLTSQSFAGNKTFTDGINVPIVPANTTYTTVSTEPVDSLPGSIFIQDRYAYVAGQSPLSNVQIYDLTIPTAPTLIGAMPGIVDIAEVSIVLGNLAYLIQDFVIQIYDITNPALAVSLGSLNVGVGIDGAAVLGNYVYIVGNDSTVKTYSVIDPTNIVFVSSVPANSGNAGMTSDGKCLFLWEYDTNTFEIFDISNPELPVSRSITTISGVGTNWGAVQDTHFYVVANGSGGFEAWDISDITAPVLSSSLNITAEPQNVVVQGNTAFVTSPDLDGVQVIDITNPSAMSILGLISTGAGSTPVGITVSGRYVYTCNTGNGTMGIINTIGAYVQQLEAGGIETGSLTIRQSAAISNNLDVKGSASFGGPTNFQSDLGVGLNFRADGTITASNFSGSSSGTNTGDVTLGTANGLSLSAQVLSLGLSSTSTTGALSSTDWNTFNGKQAPLTLGNLTSIPTTNLVVTGGTNAVIGSGVLLTLTGASLVEATSSVLTITGATNAVLGTGVSIQVKQAATAQSGYLSSTDWNTFNGKQAAGSYITALTGDGTASGPGSAAFTLATVNANVGSFGSVTQVPVITVNAKGLITAVSNTSIQIAESQVTNLVSDLAGKQPTGNYITALTGDVTASGPGSVAATLATVNSNVGSFTSANITVNAKGLITAAANGTSNSFVAPTVQTFTSSSGTYTIPTSPRMPLYLRVRLVGGGGGGGGSGITPGTATSGGNTTFGTSLLVGNGGVGGGSGAGGLGGTASLGSGPLGIAVAGSQGAGSVTPGLSGNNSGGAGGATPFGGAGGGASSTNGTSAATNSGSGGGGGGAAAAVAIGGGGGAGGFVDVIITSPLSTYAYGVGAAGSGGSGSTASGGNGAAGIIIVEEYYQ